MLALPRPLLTLRLAREYALDTISKGWTPRDGTEIVLRLALPAGLDRDAVALLAEVPASSYANRFHTCWEAGVHDAAAGTLTWRLRDGPARKTMSWELRIHVHDSPPSTWTVVYDPAASRPALTGEDNGLLQWHACCDIVNPAYGRSSTMTRLL
jgi:hypothetical protein